VTHKKIFNPKKDIKQKIRPETGFYINKYFDFD